VTSNPFEAFQQFIRDEGGSESLDGFFVVAVYEHSRHLKLARPHIPSDLPSASTPPSTSNGVIFCSFATPCSVWAVSFFCGTGGGGIMPVSLSLASLKPLYI